MNAEALVSVRDAVHRLADALGVPRDALARVEALDRLVWVDDRWPRDRVATLDPAAVRALVAAAPVQATLAQGDVDLLPLDAPDDAWATFREVTRGNPWLTLTLTVDKTALGADAQTRVVLHPEVLARVWSPAALEAALPGPLPLTIRVAAPGLALAGAGFAIGDATPRRPADADGWMTRARPSLRWSEPWAETLGPNDLLVEGPDPCDHLVTRARALAVEAALRCLADAVLPDGPVPQASFVSRGVRVDVPAHLGGPIRPEAAATLVRLTGWAFQAPFTPERLGVVRGVIADALGPLAPEDRPARLLADAERIELIAYDRFQGFVDQRLDAWAAETRRLDEEVMRAIVGYSDEISAMIKDLSDAALAAVGVMVAAVVTSATRADAALPVLLAAYAGYIALFPWALRLGWHRERHALVGERLEGVLERYRAVIGRARVDALVGDRAARLQSTFTRWDRRSTAAYAALVAAALLGAALTASR